MSLKSKRICKCCGKEYDYCPHCGTKSDELWKNLTDTKECLAVFNIVAAYNVGRATPEQVKKVLDDNNIKDYSAFNSGIVATLNKILDLVKDPVEEPPVLVKESVIEKINPTAPHIYDVIPEVEEPKIEEPKPETSIEVSAPIEKTPVIELEEIEVPIAKPQNTVAPRKSRNKKKYRKRNADIEL